MKRRPMTKRLGLACEWGGHLQWSLVVLRVQETVLVTASERKKTTEIHQICSSRSDSHTSQEWPQQTPAPEPFTTSHPTSPLSSPRNPSPRPTTQAPSSGSAASQTPTAQSHTLTPSPNHSAQHGPSCSPLSVPPATAGEQVASLATPRK